MILNNLKFLRRSPEFDISQEELALAIGTTRDRISQIENGSLPNGRLMLAISKFFDRDIREIFFTVDVGCTTQKVRKKSKKKRK